MRNIFEQMQPDDGASRPVSGPESRRIRMGEVLRGLLRRGSLTADLMWLATAILVSRGLLYAAGLRFHLDVQWMFLADVGALREHLLRTLYLFHAFPPGMNLLTGVLLKLSPTDITSWAHGVFVACSVVTAGSLLYMARACGVSRAASFCVALLFSLTPATLYFENLYLYEAPSTALLALSGALFHWATQKRCAGRWSAFFFCIAALGLLRSTFHWTWFVCMVGFGCAAAQRPWRRTVLISAVAPFLLLSALYAKNYALFGVFGATTWGGANVTAITVGELSKEERQAWAQAGKLSPYATLSVFAPPEKYRRYFKDAQSEYRERWPELDELTRPESKAGNYNHWYFLEVNPARRADAVTYLKDRPAEYVKTVLTKSLVQTLSSSTHWHPHDKKETSPHHQHRQVLGKWETLYDRVVHSAVFAPVGLYALLPLLLAAGVVLGWKRVRAAAPSELLQRGAGCLLLFAVFQVVYVVALSALLTLVECARYRYLAEPYIWLVTGVTLTWTWRRFAWRGESATRREPSLP